MQNGKTVFAILPFCLITQRGSPIWITENLNAGNRTNGVQEQPILS